jgi:hypothetical protein
MMAYVRRYVGNSETKKGDIMNGILKSTAVLGLGLFLYACESAQKSTIPLTEFTECKDPRSEMCTREYRPVCAKRDTGEWVTKGNSCTACADPKVHGYTKDACVK